MKIRVIFYTFLFLVGCKIVEPGIQNETPSILGFSVDNLTVVIGDSVFINYSVIDPDNDQVYYIWECESGYFIEIDSSMIWIASDSSGNYELLLIVTDSISGFDSASVDINVQSILESYEDIIIGSWDWVFTVSPWTLDTTTVEESGNSWKFYVTEDSIKRYDNSSLSYTGTYWFEENYGRYLRINTGINEIGVPIQFVGNDIMYFDGWMYDGFREVFHRK